MRKIDGYGAAQRKKLTYACIVYARQRAIEWLGSTAYHQCDESCNHQVACEGCRYFSPDPSGELPIGVSGVTCLHD